MVPITARYDGDLVAKVTHGPSGSAISTDAPKDNGGQGRTFSPTDLVGAALASCILTTMDLVARRHELDLRGATAAVEKHMVANPRRIGRLPVVVRVPGQFTETQRKLLEAAAHSGPVHRSLHAELDSPITFEWTG